MIEPEVPGWGSPRIAHLVLDVNGTLSLDGDLLPGVPERVAALRRLVEVHLVSADTWGRLDDISAALGVVGVRVRRGEPESPQKAAYVRDLGPTSVVAIGNGANDEGMLREAALGIVVLGPEGLAASALDAAELVVGSIDDALDLLLNPRRLTATLRR